LRREVNAFAARAGSGSDRDDRFDACGLSPFEDGVAAVVEVFLVDVSVRVEEHDSAWSNAIRRTPAPGRPGSLAL
jgi:hypothetical protein